MGQFDNEIVAVRENIIKTSTTEGELFTVLQTFPFLAYFDIDLPKKSLSFSLSFTNWVFSSYYAFLAKQLLFQSWPLIS